MSMNEFRRLAAKMDQHMQQLSAQGVNDAHAIINRMMGYVPDLHKIWVGTSDDQLIALSNEFPGFYRYALIMEEASEAERNKASRPYEESIKKWALCYLCLAESIAHSAPYCQALHQNANVFGGRIDGEP
jgi:hypothetical protein